MTPTLSPASVDLNQMFEMFEQRPYFVIGDLVSNSAAGAVVALTLATMVGEAWLMPVAVIVGMVIGSLMATLLSFVAAALFGAMEVMIPMMMTGMMTGMRVTWCTPCDIRWQRDRTHVAG